MDCENCNTENIPEDNIQRVCAYQIDHEVELGHKGYWGAIFCDCCDNCRQLCHEGLFEDNNEEN